MTLDVIICTYNNALLLRRTLESLEFQKVPQGLLWQVLVVNNNCTDETESVIEEFIKNRKINLTSIKETTQGLTPARLGGVKNTNSEWLAFIDDDCFLSNDWLEQTMVFAQLHPHCGAFGGKIELLFEKQPPEYVYLFPYAYAGRNLGSNTFKRKSLAGLGMTLRREALENTGWIKQPLLDDRIGNRLISGGDVEIGLRISSKYDIWYTPDCLITHIIPERRTSRQYLRKMLFGLGVSRHHAAALTWRKSYFLFILFEILMSLGFIIKCSYDGFKELLTRKERAGFSVNMSTAYGWVWAMVCMMRMETTRRNTLLGGAY